jgi:hypothetical protein
LKTCGKSVKRGVFSRYSICKTRTQIGYMLDRLGTVRL